MPKRPRVLMVTPIVPATFGNGLSMRAAMTLRALAPHYHVSLLILPLYAGPSGKTLAPELMELCDEVHFGTRRLDMSAIAPPKAGSLSGPFDVVHVFRLASLPSARRWFEGAGAIHLDLDDVESVSRPRIAALYREQGRMNEAASEERAAQLALQAEIEALMHFDRVYVCSREDLERLPFCGSAEVRILPNVVEIPSTPAVPPEPGEVFTFLFVGNLSYFPNEEGLVHFATVVLPLLRPVASQPFRIRIAGLGATPTVQNLAHIPEIELIGQVAEVAPWYATAHAVLAPIRAGGGTRIKVLEAFAFQRPVVSTAIGVEGFAVQHQEHALIADQPVDFAEACRRLLMDASLRLHLADRAFELVRDSYSPVSMIRAVAPGATAAQLH